MKEYYPPIITTSLTDFIDSKGNLLTSMDHYEEGPGYVMADMDVYEQITLFARLGHTPLLIFSAAILIATTAKPKKSRP